MSYTLLGDKVGVSERSLRLKSTLKCSICFILILQSKFLQSFSPAKLLFSLKMGECFEKWVVDFSKCRFTFPESVFRLYCSISEHCSYHHHRFRSQLSDSNPFVPLSFSPSYFPQFINWFEWWPFFFHLAAAAAAAVLFLVVLCS